MKEEYETVNRLEAKREAYHEEQISDFQFLARQSVFNKCMGQFYNGPLYKGEATDQDLRAYDKASRGCENVVNEFMKWNGWKS